VNSTNDIAREAAENNTEGNLWVVAHEQTAGRGRRGREWVSEPGNLFCSLLLKLDVSVADAAQLSFVASLAVRDTLADILSNDDIVRCKWPNDILIQGRKVCGILLESAGVSAAQPEYVIIGIGINLKTFPDETMYETTCLAKESGRDHTLEEVMAILAPNMTHWISIWQQKGFTGIRTVWLKKAAGLKKDMTVRLNNQQISGQFVDLDPTGGLILSTEDGMKTITAGDVFIL